MAQNMRRQPRRKGGVRSALYGPVAFLVICAALVFAMSIFFRVSRLEVVGHAYYTAEEVERASGIEEGDNLFFINRFTAVSRIFARLPYVETASVTRYLPNRVVIEVTESQAIAYVTVESELWVIDRNGKVLTQGGAAEAATLIEITGLTPQNPTVGEVIDPGEDAAAKLPYLAELLDQIQERGLQAGVTAIDMTDASAPTLSYIGRFTVRFGPQADTEYKFGKLLSAVEQLTDGDRGTIDVSLEGQKALFSPG